MAKNRQVSTVKGGVDSIYNVDDSINTRHHANWNKLSKANCKKVNNELACLGLGRKVAKVWKPCDKIVAENKRDEHNLKNQLIQLKKANVQHKCTIASLKCKLESQVQDVNMEDAGDAFGGKSKKKKGDKK